MSCQGSSRKKQETRVEVFPLCSPVVWWHYFVLATLIFLLKRSTTWSHFVFDLNAMGTTEQWLYSNRIFEEATFSSWVERGLEVACLEVGKVEGPIEGLATQVKETVTWIMTRVEQLGSSNGSKRHPGKRQGRKWVAPKVWHSYICVMMFHSLCFMNNI